jgi:PadR family transcriptional regulator, regulatory protein PadR
MADSSLIRGTLDLLILKALAATARNGFEIVAELESRTGGALEVEDSALYQALHRMEARGLIEAEWGVSENNRRARYYTITKTGRSHLKVESQRWLDSAKLVQRVLA